MRAQPKRSSMGDAVNSALPSARRELYRELCQDEDGNRYTVVYRTHPDLNVTVYELEDGTPVRFVDDCLFEIEPNGRTLTRCPDAGARNLGAPCRINSVRRRKGFVPMNHEADGSARIWIRLGVELPEKPMSSSYPPANPKMTYSRLAGREVSTWSEEWKHECEIAYLAGMKPEKLKGMLYGVQGAQDESARGIKSHRGDAAVAKLVSEIERYKRAAG